MHLCTSLFTKTFGVKGIFTTACYNKGVVHGMGQLNHTPRLKYLKDPDGDLLMITQELENRGEPNGQLYMG